MLSDTIYEILEKLKADMIHYTTGQYAYTYGYGLRVRLEKIVAELEAIRLELDNPNSSETLPGPGKSMDLLTLKPIEANRKHDKKSTEELTKAFAKKFPYAYGLIVAHEPDLSRWIFDNLVNSSKK